MRTSDQVALDILQTASIATVATTAATVACGAIENRNPAAPVNAISHIAWGDKAANREAVSGKYTGVGAGLNAAAMVPWAAVHHMLFRPRNRDGGGASAFGALARGAITSGIAYVVDYHVVPRRLTPGFEKRLSTWSLFTIYAALAVSLAAGERFAQRATAHPNRRRA